MKTRKACEGLIAVAILSSLGNAMIMPSHAQHVSAPAPAAQASAPDMRASKLIGAEARNAQGENVGKIEDAVINIDNEKLQYLLLSSGGLLGLGDRLIPIPASAFAIDGKGQLVLNVDKEQLKKAPGFRRNQRPNFSEETYRNEVDRFFFKEEIARHTPSGARLVNASDLIGKDINDRAAHDAGEVEDIVVNLGNGRAYMVMEVDKAWSPESKLLPLPLSALTVPRRPDLDLILNVDRPRIENAPGFAQNKWPDLASPAYQRQVTDYLASFQAQSKSAPNLTQTGREPVTSGASR